MKNQNNIILNHQLMRPLFMFLSRFRIDSFVVELVIGYMIYSDWDVNDNRNPDQ